MADDQSDQDAERMSRFHTLDGDSGRLAAPSAGEADEDDEDKVVTSEVDEDEDEDEDEPARGEVDEDEDEDEDDGESAVDKDRATDEADDEEPPKKKRKPTTQERINQAIKRQREAERERDAWKAQAQAKPKPKGEDEAPKDDVKKDTTPKADLSDLEEPNPDDFEFGEVDAKYREAIRNYDREVVRRELKADADAAKAAEAAEAAKADINARVDTVDDEGGKLYEDYQEKVYETAWPLSDTLGELIAKADDPAVGAKIAYHLATNPAEALRVFGSSNLEQAAYFGRKEAEFASDSEKSDGKKDTTKQISKAPAPLNRHKLKGKGGKFKTSPATTDYKAFKAMAMAEQNKR